MFATNSSFPSKQNGWIITRKLHTNMGILLISWLLMQRPNHNAYSQLWRLWESWQQDPGLYTVICPNTRTMRVVGWQPPLKGEKTNRQGRPLSSWAMSEKRSLWGRIGKPLGWSSETPPGFAKGKAPSHNPRETVLPWSCGRKRVGSGVKQTCGNWSCHFDAGAESGHINTLKGPVFSSINWD